MYVGKDEISGFDMMKWIINFLLDVIILLWLLWVAAWGRADVNASYLKWFSKCEEAKKKSGGIIWNEFLATMKYLCLHYVQKHAEAEKYFNYESFVNMTPFYPQNMGLLSETDEQQLLDHIYGIENVPQENVQDKAIEGHERHQDNKKAIEPIYEEPVIINKEPTPVVQPQNVYETYEWEEEEKPKTWLWILLAILIVGGGAWYFLSREDEYVSQAAEASEMVETTPDEANEETEEEETEAEVTGYHSFLEQFYKKYGDEDYLLAHITANVKNKLRRDYDYDCETNDCLAAWVFTAYPGGGDLEMEEGPIITETDVEGRYRVDFKYSASDGERKMYYPRTVYLSVSQVDGKYLISDYEVVEDTPNQDEAASEDQVAKPNLTGDELSVRKLTEEDIAKLGPRDLEILKSIVYARYGYVFQRDDLNQFFSQYSWYTPATDDIEWITDKFTEIERYNVDFIKTHE